MLQDALTFAFDGAFFGGLAWIAIAFCSTLSKPLPTKSEWIEPVELSEDLAIVECPDLFEVEQPEAATPNLANKSVKELRTLCRDRRIPCKLWKSARKEQILALLNPPLVSRPQPKTQSRNNHRLYGLRVG